MRKYGSAQQHESCFERLCLQLRIAGGRGVSNAVIGEALVRDEYANAVSLEWERQWHPDLPLLELALEAAANRGWW
jgi:hypothetical protein